MKTITYLCFCFMIVSCDEYRTNDVLWEAFKLDFRKNYSQVGYLEEESRRSAFHKSFKAVMDCNESYAKKKISFSCDLNRYGDMTAYDVQLMSNSLRDGAEVDTSEYYRMYNSSVERCLERCIPRSWNWVKVNPDLDVVLDQGEPCGSCYAFASAAAIEAHNYIHNGGNFVKLSEQQIVDCGAEFGNKGCNGGSVQAAYNYFISNINVSTGKKRPVQGAVSEADYPYVADNSTKCYYRTKKAKVFLRAYMGIPPNENVLKVAIARYGPVVAAMDASLHSFHFYRKGIYDDPRCQSNKITHAVLIVGYGRKNGKDYWIIKNSWGRDWGMKGYGRVLQNGRNFCGLLNTLIVPIIDREKTNKGIPKMDHFPISLEYCRRCMRGRYRYFGQISPIEKFKKKWKTVRTAIRDATTALDLLPYGQGYEA